MAQPTLKRKDLNPEFFPTGLYEAYFNPRKKLKSMSCNIRDSPPIYDRSSSRCQSFTQEKESEP